MQQSKKIHGTLFKLTLFPGTIGDGALGMDVDRLEGGAKPSLDALVAGMRDMGRVRGNTSPFWQILINFIA